MKWSEKNHLDQLKKIQQCNTWYFLNRISVYVWTLLPSNSVLCWVHGCIISFVHMCNTSRVHCWIVGENLLPRGPELRWLHPGWMWSDQEWRAQPPHESQMTTWGWISLKTTEKTEFVAFNAKFIRRRFRVCCRCFKKIKFLLTLQLNGWSLGMLQLWVQSV